MTARYRLPLQSYSLAVNHIRAGTFYPSCGCWPCLTLHSTFEGTLSPDAIDALLLFSPVH